MKKGLAFASMMATSALFLSACSVSFSTASISEVLLCAQQVEKSCVENQTTFPVGTPEFVADVRLSNAPEGTKLRGEWFYLPAEQKVAEVSITSESGQNAFNFPLTDNSGNGFPAGDYEFHIYLNAETEPKVYPFQVQ
jgi:hypothetical protein